MNTINKLKEQIAALQQQTDAQVAALQTQLQDALNAVFDDCGELQQALAVVQNSKEYGIDEGGIYQWLRFDLSRFAGEQEQLQTYLQDNFVHADFENDALLYYIGPQLIINDDGDIYDEDSGKWIISCDEYDTDADRNTLIEQWMDENGYYPGVFRVDRYNNVFLVNTQAK